MESSAQLRPVGARDDFASRPDDGRPAGSRDWARAARFPADLDDAVRRGAALLAARPPCAGLAARREARRLLGRAELADALRRRRLAEPAEEARFSGRRSDGDGDGDGGAAPTGERTTLRADAEAADLIERADRAPTDRARDGRALEARLGRPGRDAGDAFDGVLLGLAPPSLALAAAGPAAERDRDRDRSRDRDVAGRSLAERRMRRGGERRAARDAGLGRAPAPRLRLVGDPDAGRLRGRADAWLPASEPSAARCASGRPCRELLAQSPGRGAPQAAASHASAL